MLAEPRTANTNSKLTLNKTSISTNVNSSSYYTAPTPSHLIFSSKFSSAGLEGTPSSLSLNKTLHKSNPLILTNLAAVSFFKF